MSTEPKPAPLALTDEASRGGTARLSRSLSGTTIGDYLVLAKPEITLLVALSALAGFLLGSPGSIDGVSLAITLLGVTLCSAGAGTLNHVLERDRDLAMKRTLNRPIPAGRVAPGPARNLGLALSATGLALLCPLVNPLTSVLAAVSMLLYLFVYTPLKSKTWLNTVVGAVPGALPAIGGYAAATNSVAGPSAWLIFGILLFWQIPHFLALAWMYRRDYGRGGFAMLPTIDDDGTATAAMALGFCVGTIALSLALAEEPSLGPVYLVAAALGGALFLLPAVRFWTTRSNADARRLLKASVLYIPILVASIVLDRLV